MEAGYVWFRIFLPHCSFSFSAFLLCSVSFQSFFFLNASLSVLWAYYSELFWLSLILHCFPRHYSMHFRIITDYLKLCLSIIETRHDWATSLSLFTFMHWRRKWQPTSVFLPGESQGRGACWAAVSGVAQSWTRLKLLSSSIIETRPLIWLLAVRLKEGAMLSTEIHWMLLAFFPEKAIEPHSSTLAWKIPWMEEPGRLQSMGSLRVGHDWATSLSLFTFLHWRRKWQPTPVFLPGESQGWWSLVGCRLWGQTESDKTEVT